MPSHTRFGMCSKMFAIPPTHSSECSPAGGINFLKSACFSCHEGGVLQVYSAVGIWSWDIS
jgi:hypothetical protein